MTWFLFFLLALATARVTWFLAEDHMPLIAGPRDWVTHKWPDSNIAYLVECWFCVSVYVAAGAAAFAVWVMDINIGLWPGDTGDPVFQNIDDWQVFLLLWPALSFAACGIMGLVDKLTAD